jgi:hypothetical protein
MEGLKAALCSVRVPSLVQMRSADYWRSLLTNKGAGTGGGSGASHKNGGAFFGTFEVTYLVFCVDNFNVIDIYESTVLSGYIYITWSTKKNAEVERLHFLFALLSSVYFLKIFL